MDFLEALNSGINNAKIVRDNKAEIQKTLEFAVSSIGSILDINVSLNRREPTSFDEYTRVSLTTEINNKKHPLFAIKEDYDGYPLTIHHNESELFCANNEDFKHGLHQLFKDAQFGLIILNIKDSIAQSILDTKDTCE